MSYKRGLQEDCFSGAVSVGDIPSDAKAALWIFGGIAVVGLLVISRPRHQNLPEPRSIDLSRHVGYGSSRRFLGSGMLS